MSWTVAYINQDSNGHFVSRREVGTVRGTAQAAIAEACNWAGADLTFVKDYEGCYTYQGDGFAITVHL